MKEDQQYSDPMADNLKRGEAALAARDASLNEGIKGSLLATAFAVGAHALGNRVFPAYRAVNFRLKTFWWSSFVVAAFWVRTEQEQVQQLRKNYGYDEEQ